MSLDFNVISIVLECFALLTLGCVLINLRRLVQEES